MRLATLILVCGFFAPETVHAGAVETSDPAAGLKLYRNGLRPSGEQLTAIVAGDVPIVGTQFSCQNCHGRSGMGAIEGNYIVPPIGGRFLYSASSQPERPANDQESLGRALRDGVDPAGRPLDPLMPRYILSDNEVSLLGVYLQGLSVVESSPGINNEVIHLATVVADDVKPDVRNAVLEVIKRYVDEMNRQTRLEGQRPNRGSKPEIRLPTLYRKWVHEVWTLKGPSESWREQLESYYKHTPVFALLGGLSPATWRPIGRFSEQHEIPCLFPSTNLPDAEEVDFYTIHFSRGLELEAELVAKDLSKHPSQGVIQVYCTGAGGGAADALRSALMQKGVRVEDFEFACDEAVPEADISARMMATPELATVLWMNRERLAQLEQPMPKGRIYVSSTLLERDLDGLAVSVDGPVIAAHPYRLPGERDSAMGRFTLWARTRGIDIRYPRLQAEAFFAAFATADALAHVRRYRLRDYVLEMLDHSEALALYLPIHPSPSFGPGQRFLTKGGYLLPIADGQPDIKNASWVLP